MATKRRTAKRGKKQPAPEMDAQWSILLFGLGALLLALTYVKGEAGWAWLRQNILFGVFGIGAYLIAPLMLAAAVLVALGKPVRVRMLKGLAVMLLLCGAWLIFSKIEMQDLTFNDGMVLLYQTSVTEWGIAPGALSAVLGWSLLALCGRPGANIIIVLLVLLGVMLVTGVTPADIYFFFYGHAGRVKESVSGGVSRYQEERAQRAATRAATREAQREDEATQQALRLANSRAPIDMDAFNAAMESEARQRMASVDIDLGPDVPHGGIGVTVTSPATPVEIGPGGTFGRDVLHGVVQPDAEFGAIISRRAPATVPPTAPPVAVQATETPIDIPIDIPKSTPKPAAAAATPAQRQTAAAPEAQPPEDDIARLARKAALAPSEVVLDNNDQLTIVQSSEKGYVFPPLRLFQKQAADNETDVQQELTHNADLLVKTLSSFGVQTRILDISRGPSVTRYEVQPLAGVKISRITGLSDDIALNLAATGVRIEAPIPGKAAVGIEVPNRNRSVVGIRSILESPVFTQSSSPVTMALGVDIAGKSWAWNLAKMPHVLIAGSTGSGKSVCINAIIMSFLYRSSPEDLRLIMIDPKMVELSDYNGIPHLLMPVVTEPRKAAGALGSAVAEMEKRYQTFAELGVRNIDAYNEHAAKEGTERMPYIAIIIDELADLMMVAGKEVEDYICRIAQKARAAGMHLIIATQRPSVDVITGLIKANVPSRIAFAVSSQIDSRTILDSAGAEKLLGNGDMLFMPVGAAKPTRIQGTYVRDEEIKAVQDFIKKHAEADYNEEMIAEMEKRAVPEKGAENDEESSQDPMFNTAVETILDAQQASTSLLQRRCKLGYARAARIMDEIEAAHIIGPSEGSKPRQILITRQQWIEMTMRRPDDEPPFEV